MPQDQVVFWSPKKLGETLKGNFLEFQSWPTEQGQRFAMKLETDQGVLLVGLGSVLRNLLSQVWKTCKPGTIIELEYQGKSKRTNLFTCKINGELLKQFAASEEKLASFFNN